jgi:hypothetical protein
MRRLSRRTTPKVVNGRVQRKNRHEPTATYWSEAPASLIIDRERPRRGYRHLLRKQDILDFIEIIPDWDKLSQGLRAIVLAEGDANALGWYWHRGIIELCAWDRGLWLECSPSWFDGCAPLLRRLGVVWEKHDKLITVKFTEGQARAFQLLEIFLHELGHHHDRMTTKARYRTGRGEPYAENYAQRHAEAVWEHYSEVFGPVE